MEKTHLKHLKQDSELQEDMYNLLEMMILIDDCKNTTLDEGAVDTVKSWYDKFMKIISKKVDPVANKAGLHINTKNKGLLQYLSGASVGTSKLLYHAVNGYYNDNKSSKIKAKELIQSVDKTEVVDFLLKLDQLSMHWFTGPIHWLDAVTGTHIWSNIQDKVTDVSDRAHNAIEGLEQLKDKLEGKLKVQLQNYANGLRRIFGIEGFGKVSEETITPDIAEPDIKIGDMAMRKRLRKKKNGKCINNGKNKRRKI